MRGDRPLSRISSLSKRAFTPHARGSTSLSESQFVPGRVYPACAGIDRACLCHSCHRAGLPRMRGDRPKSPNTHLPLSRFTPHARGSTQNSVLVRRKNGVYPACAGIDLERNLFVQFLLCLPRMRGDRPSPTVSILPALSFTPHARGSTCFVCSFLHIAIVYPACAGIDLGKLTY